MQRGTFSVELFFSLLDVLKFFYFCIIYFVWSCYCVKMRSRPPGTKSATVDDTEEWDPVEHGTTDLAPNYGMYTVLYTMLHTMLHTMLTTLPYTGAAP